jgi:hypothetical protein
MPAQEKFVAFPFTRRRIEMAQEVLNSALAYMGEKKSKATDPKEVEFYGKQTVEFFTLAAILAKTYAAVGVKGGTRKVRLSETHFQILNAGVSNRNLNEIHAISELAEGTEKEQRLASFGEWEAFSNDLNKKDPRQFDMSQDAEPDEEEDEGEAASC